MKPLRERDQAHVGVATLVILLLGGVVAFNLDDLPLIGGGVTYRAHFAESAGLASGNEVRVAGVKVGKVTDVELAADQVDVVFRVRDTWLGTARRRPSGSRRCWGRSTSTSPRWAVPRSTPPRRSRATAPSRRSTSPRRSVSSRRR